MAINAMSFVAIFWIIHKNASLAEDIAGRAQTLNVILGDLAKLELVAGDMNAPGNDVFESKNVKVEENRFSTYRSNFREEFSSFKSLVSDSLPLASQKRILKKLESVEMYSNLFADITLEIFANFKKNSLETASKKMAQMDRSFSEFRKAIIEVRRELRKIDDEVGIQQYSLVHGLTQKTIFILVVSLLFSAAMTVVGLLARNKSRSDENILRFYKFAIDQAAIVATTDTQGRIKFANEKFSEISGYSPNELVGEDRRLLNSDCHPKEFFKELWKTIGAGKVWHGEIRNRRKDGSVYWVDSTIIPMMDESANISQYVSIRFDITARKEYEAQVEAATRAKSSFLANMSHEIRTPLNGVLGMATLLSDEKLSPDGARYLEIMKNSGNTLLALINDILDFSKIEAGKLSLEYVSFGLESTVQELVSFLDFKAKEKGLTIHVDMDKSLPKFISADVTRFKQVFTNLFSNATKFTQKGSITIRAMANLTPDGKYLIQFDIIDSGLGMSEEAQSKLFRSFSQVDASTTRRFGGTGLGLAICKGICEAMGGKIWVKSEVGKGSTFSFTFVGEKAESLATTSGGSDIATTDLGQKFPYKILVADDHSTNQILAKSFLEKLGYVPDIVGNGLEVLNALKQKSYDLIFMDGHMPEMDGYETTVNIRKRHGKQAPWIVALTASASSADRERCFACGMNDFVSKPFSISALATAIMRVGGNNIVQNQSESVTGLAKNEIDFDANRILKHFAGDEDIMQTVIKDFLATLPTLQEIENALKTRNAREFAGRVHTLKGTVSIFFVEPLQDLLYELEMIGKNNRLGDIGDRMDVLKRQISDLKAHLDVMLKEKWAA